MASQHEQRHVGGAITPPPLMSVDDAARFLSISRRQVYRLIDSGELKPFRVGQRLRFPPVIWSGRLERENPAGAGLNKASGRDAVFRVHRR